VTLFRQCVRVGLFPTVFVGGQAIGFWAIGTGQNHELVVGGVTLGVVLIIAIFERIQPFHSSWNQSREDVRTDFTHAVVSMIILPKVLEIGQTVGLLSLAVFLTEMVGGSLWPHQWALFPQLLLAMLISQFGEYWAHRCMHEIPLLWRLHATHHSPERLYWLNAARFHPLDTAVSYTIATFPLILLGAGAEMLLLYSIWVMVHGMFQHCNIDLKLGPLNYIFSMAELHRWHHSLVLEEANSNYGNNIIFWDLVFGTLFYPKDRTPSEFIGLSEIKNFPKGYWGQVMSPFRWKTYGAITPLDTSEDAKIPVT